MQQSLSSLRSCFHSGATKPYAFRKQQLLALKRSVIAHEEAIYTALASDLKKSREECWVTENGFVLAELDYALRHLQNWMHGEKVPTNLLNFPSSSYIQPEPMGVVLIIGPWNYPFQLLLTPLIGAIAAGNCAVVKPSEFAPATAKVIADIISEVFDPSYITCLQGDGAQVIGDMMNSFRFDHVFYTGSTGIGQKVYELAAKKLTPVTLELGGKSPCVIEADANITVAAKRIAMTKFSNAGQMCVAPDYLLVHASVREAFLREFIKYIDRFFGDNPQHVDHYGKIVNEKQFDRLLRYLADGTIVHGGQHERSALYIAPTVMTDVAPDSPIMQEEIFGPLLPVFSFSETEEALSIIQRHADPLALYVFTSSRKKEKEWLQLVPSGGACINNASWHLTNPNLPFGGRGNSGIGSYHGEFSFDAFSHRRAVLKTPAWFDPSIKYPPFKGKLKLFKWIMR